MDIESIKIISVICSIIGSSLLAFRVTGMLRALAIVADCHEYNLNGLVSVNQNSKRELIQLGKSTEHVKKAQKLPLLMAGFVLIIMATVLQFLALIIQNGTGSVPNKRVKFARKNHGLGFGDKTRLTPCPNRYV